MTLQDIFYTLPSAAMRILSVILFMGQIYICQQMVHLRRKPGIILLSVMNALMGALFFAVMMDDPDRVTYRASLWFHELTLYAFHLPVWVFALAEAGLILLLGLFALDIVRYTQNHVTTGTIKEAVDLLPTAVCFGDERGEALLSNIRMNDACFAMTGRPMQDTEVLWETVRQQGEEQDAQYLVRTKDGSALLFSRSRVTMEGKTYTQLLAADMTAPAQISAELRAKNAELWQVQYRMKAYQARAAEMFIEEELLTARSEVHDGLGHLLLMGRYYLDHPEKTDEAELLRLMRQASGSLMAAAEAPQVPKDPYEEALRRAGRIGVAIETKGSVPSSGKARELIGHALGECAANAVKHAGGQRVRMTVTEEGSRLRAVLTNDGEAPTEPVRELGGLRTLRRLTEDAGGSMTLESAPRFQLTLVLPKDIA